MERQIPSEIIEIDMQTAREHGVHIDVAVNPFIDEKDRQAILENKIQDPEWD